AVSAARKGAGVFADASAIEGSGPVDFVFSFAAQGKVAEAAQSGGNRIHSVQPDHFAAVQGGNDSRVFAGGFDHSGRGGAVAGRFVPGGAADAGGVGGPVDVAVDGVREAGIFLGGVGEGGRRLAALRGAGDADSADRAGVSGEGAARAGRIVFSSGVFMLV